MASKIDQLVALQILSIIERFAASNPINLDSILFHALSTSTSYHLNHHTSLNCSLITRTSSLLIYRFYPLILNQMNILFIGVT